MPSMGRSDAALSVTCDCHETHLGTTKNPKALSALGFGSFPELTLREPYGRRSQQRP